MELSSRHRAAESQFRQLINGADLAQPDDVTYARESLTFRWHEAKLAVIVDLEEPEPDGSSEGGVVTTDE